MLFPGMEVQPLSSNSTCSVIQLLGEGGQGAVYEVGLPDDRRQALKWYHPRSATDAQWRSLADLIDRGPPDLNFLWPLDLARSTRSDGFGYLMSLREPRFAGIVERVTGRVNVSFRTMATVGLELAHSFLMLHSGGLCYRDISFGNVFFDPATGDVLICDVDNVGINEENPTGVLGTPYFMAPEIVRGEALPSTSTDLFSLSVLLFHVFMIDHPLEGKRALEYACWDQAAMQDLFGNRPAFIFDPVDPTNEAAPGLNDNALMLWPLYPAFLRQLFLRAFTTGLHDPHNGRVQESVWRSAMARLRDSVVYCGCGKQNLYDEEAPDLVCWSCRSAVIVPPKLRIGRQLVVLNHDTRIFGHHLCHDYDFATVVGEVSQHPTNPDLWGLRNDSGRAWVATSSHGTVEEVEPGRTLRLQSDLHVDFGPVMGDIVP